MRSISEVAADTYDSGALWEDVAGMVLLHALDLMDAAGVAPAQVATGLRGGKTLGQVIADARPTMAEIDGEPASCGSCGWAGQCPLPLESLPPRGICPRCGGSAVGVLTAIDVRRRVLIGPEHNIWTDRPPMFDDVFEIGSIVDLYPPASATEAYVAGVVRVLRSACLVSEIRIVWSKEET